MLRRITARLEDVLQYVLIVTWFVYGSSPSDYQVQFKSEKARDEARLKALREADRLSTSNSVPSSIRRRIRSPNRSLPASISRSTCRT